MHFNYEKSFSFLSIVLFIFWTLVHFIFLIFINNLHSMIFSLWSAFCDWSFIILTRLTSVLRSYIFPWAAYTSWFSGIWFFIFIFLFNIHLFFILIVLCTHTILFGCWLLSFAYHLILTFIQNCRFSLFFLFLLLALKIFSSNFLWVKYIFVCSVHFLLKLIDQWFDVILYKFFKLK